VNQYETVTVVRALFEVVVESFAANRPTVLE